jgi:hypothetical protein
MPTERAFRICPWTHPSLDQNASKVPIVHFLLFISKFLGDIVVTCADRECRYLDRVPSRDVVRASLFPYLDRAVSP